MKMNDGKSGTSLTVFIAIAAFASGLSCAKKVEVVREEPRRESSPPLSPPNPPAESEADAAKRRSAALDAFLAEAKMKKQPVSLQSPSSKHNIAAQPKETPIRERLLQDIVARGSADAKAGNADQAKGAWNIVLYYDPDHVGAKNALAGVTATGFSTSNEEQKFLTETIQKSETIDYWCPFTAPAADMELIDLKMLSDVRLLPNLRATSMNFSGCDEGVFVFLAKPLLTAPDVRKAYGPPRSSKKTDAGAEILTYGRLKIDVAQDGSCRCIVFPPANVVRKW